jgi:hypothetical protein
MSFLQEHLGVEQIQWKVTWICRQPGQASLPCEPGMSQVGSSLRQPDE